jgi:hypothetical protein
MPRCARQTFYPASVTTQDGIAGKSPIAYDDFPISSLLEVHTADEGKR